MNQDIFLLQYYDENANNFKGGLVEKQFLDIKEANAETVKKIELGYECIQLVRTDNKRGIKKVLYSEV